ncbi:hypothetical protein M0812_29768 [Anaeramoeba flamelloides]|uniref:Uncharacterized protein n=1 Tax=Anaeramoeba flamelloides TaxID=1746091 RepID=A0AAV7Y7K0_9EUKA|nr:hypothetical protein M0812_29768 [Anaeramoeba flamelloides]
MNYMNQIKLKNENKTARNPSSEYLYGGQKSGKWTEENENDLRELYPEKINLKQNDIFTIFLDMDQKKYLLKSMKKISEVGKIYPEKVIFHAGLWNQKGGEKNQKTII